MKDSEKKDQKKQEPFDASKANFFTENNLPIRHFYTEIKSEGSWWVAKKIVCEKLGTGIFTAIIGGRGTGKTQIGIEAILISSRKFRPSPRYYTAMDIFLLLRDGRHHNMSEFEILKDFLSPCLLVIDSIEVRGETEFENQILNHIIEKRHGKMLDTILISCLKKENLYELLGTNISERLKETGGIIECNWESFR